MKHDLPLVVDFHAHMLEEGVFKASTNKTVFTGFGANPMPAPRRAPRSSCTACSIRSSRSRTWTRAASI